VVALQKVQKWAVFWKTDSQALKGKCFLVPGLSDSQLKLIYCTQINMADIFCVSVLQSWTFILTDHTLQAYQAERPMMTQHFFLFRRITVLL